MDSSMINVDDLNILSSMSCQDMADMLKEVNASYYESHNATHKGFKTLTIPNCTPKPYLGIQGAGKWIISTILIIFLIFGLIGNILSATIMCRRARRGFSSYFYLAVLAVVDICVLYTSCLLFLLELAFNYHPQLKDKIYCRLGFYIQHLFTYVSAWLIVAVTFERFIVVRFPFQSILICRMRVAYVITLMIFVFFSIYTSHCFLTMDLLDVVIQTEENYHPHYSVCDLKEHRRLLSFLDLYFYSLFPSLLIIIFNILIIVTMFHAIKQRRTYLRANDYVSTRETCLRNLHQKNKSSSSIRTQFFRTRSVESTPGGGRSSNLTRTHRQGSNKISLRKKSQQVLLDPTSAAGIRLTCLLLIISSIYVLCTLPISIRGFVGDLILKSQSTNRWQLIGICFRLMMYLNHTINFVFYCLTGRAFRSECRKIFYGLCVLKDVHISCTINPDSDKHPYIHEQLIFQDRNRLMIPMQKRFKNTYL